MDRRGVKVILTGAGREVVDAAMADLLERERTLLSELPPSEQVQLAGLLRHLLSSFEVRDPAQPLGLTGNSKHRP